MRLVRRDLPRLRQLDRMHRRRIATLPASPALAHPHVNLLPSPKQAWRTPASLIGNLVSIRDSASPVLSSLRPLKCMFPRRNMDGRAARSGTKGILENVVTLGVRCCCLPWAGFAGGSRRSLWAGSPRILCRCPVLRRQVLGLCRRGMGAQSRGHRRRN
jgi:hypothetical protein